MSGLVSAAWGTQDDIAPILEAMAHRGPQATVNVGRAGAMGIRGWARSRGATIAARDQQQVVAQTELRNATWLRTKLGLEPHATGAEIVAAAYERWGTGATSHLDGDYTFVIFDEQRGRVVCARDPFGAWPLYYCRRGETFLCASEPAALTRCSGVPRRANLDQVALALAGWFNEADQTLFEGIMALPAGHALTATRASFRKARHWRPDPWRRLDVDVGEAAALVREAVERSIARRLPAEPLALFVSGGLDSAALAGEVARQCRAADVEAPLLVHATFPDARDDETAYSDEVAEMWGLEHINTRPLDDPERLSPTRTRNIDLWWDPRLGMWEQLLETMRRRGRRTGFNGNGIDEVLRATGQEWPDALRSGRVGAVLRGTGLDRAPWSLRAWRRFLKDAVLPTLSRPSHQPAPILRPRYRSAVRAEADDRDQRHPPLAYPNHVARELCRGYLEGDINIAVSTQERLSAHAGLRVYDGFLDVELVELLLSLPTEHRHLAGRDKPKPVFRQAVSHLVPQSVLKRERSGTYYHFVHRVLFGSSHEAAAKTFATPSRLEAAGLIEDETPRRLATGDPSPPPGYSRAGWAFQARSLVSMELLLRQL